MDFWSGLSQGLTNGILFRQRQEEDQFRQTQDRLIEQIHQDAKLIRPEDYPKMLQHIHDLTVAKNSKQLNEAWGKYHSRVMSENYGQEKAARDYNESVPFETDQQPITVAGQATTDSQVPGANMAAPPPVTFEPGQDAIPTAQRQVMLQDPNAYAKDSIRFRTPEGDMGRQIEFAQAKGEIQTEGRLKVERAKAEAKLNDIYAKAETAGLKGIKLTQDRETGETMLTGVDAYGNVHQESIGKQAFPQEVVAKFNMKGRKEIAELREKGRNDRAAATLKLRQEEVTSRIKLNDAKVKEINEKMAKDYYGKRGSSSNQAATLIVRKADSDIRAATTRMRSLESELSKLEALPSWERTSQTENRIAAIHIQMGSIAMELDEIQSSRDAQLGAVKDAIGTTETTAKGGSGGATTPTGKSKRPPLTGSKVLDVLGIKPK